MKYPNTTFRVLIVLLLSATLFACKKDNKPSGEKGTLLKKRITSESTITYNYDNNNRATGYSVENTNPTNNITVTYTYNSSGQLTEVRYNAASSVEDTKYVYFYNSNGQISKIEEYYVSASGVTQTLNNKFEADYGTPGKVSVYRYTSAGSGTPYLYAEYFLDAKGNVVKQQSYNASGFLIVTSEATDYDDKKTASASLPQEDFVRNVNNYCTTTVTPSGGSPSISTYTYEYNNEGYPTKITGNNGSIVSYEYILIGL